MSKPHAPTSWAEAVIDGYVAAVVKGNPHKTHAKKRGENIALCGKQPGPSRAHKIRNRTGWMFYPDDRAPNCEKCLSVIALAAAEVNQ